MRLDCNTFSNEEEFTINYDEEHLLLPNCDSDHLMIYHSETGTGNGPVTIDCNNIPKYLCFNIRLTAPGMSLIVEPHTRLSLLLNCARLKIVKLMLTRSQIVKLRDEQKIHSATDADN